MRSADAIGISGERQKWEDRRGADHLKDGLRKRERKNTSQLRSAVWARQKENATNQVGNVMDKPGHVSELHVQEIGGITSHNGEISQLSVGKLNCQRLAMSGGQCFQSSERSPRTVAPVPIQYGSVWLSQEVPVLTDKASAAIDDRTWLKVL